MARKVRPELAALRAQAIKREQDAARKVRRLESQGVRVAGSKHDVRKGAGSVNRMTEAQVRAHLERLDRFQSRRTQFVGLSGGQPVKRSQWRSYQKAERRLNARVDEFKEPMREALGVSGKQLNPSTDELFSKKTRSPHEIASESALHRLTQALRRGATDEGFSKRISHARSNIEQMLIATGDLKMLEEIRNMTDEQLIFLWENTKFAENAAHKYNIHKAANDEDRGFKEYETGITNERSTTMRSILDDVRSNTKKKGRKGRK